VPRQFNTDDLRKALDQYTDYSNENVYDADEARDVLFQDARDRGFLDDYVREMLEETGYDDDPDFEPDYIDSYDIENARDRLDVSDFPNAIPVTSNISVDPDLEEYNVYNFINENPKAREFFTDQTIDVLDTDSRNRFLRALRAGTFTPEQLATLNQVRYAGNSGLLEDTDTNEAYDIADTINRAATGRDVASFRPIYENAAEALNQVQSLQSIASNLNDYTRDLGEARDRLNTIADSSNFRSSSDLYGSNSGSDRQLSLSIPLDNSNELSRVRSNFESLPTSLNTVDELSNARNRLYSVQRDIGSLISARRDPSTSRRSFIRSSVLPQVEAALGLDDTDRAASNASRNRASSLDEALGDQRERNDYFRILRRQIPGRPAPDPYNFEPTEPLTSVSSRSGMQPIPGLNEEINRGQIEAARSVLSQFPEIEALLQTSLKDTERRPLRGADAKQYMPYIDTEQTISMPETRKNIYDRILSESSGDPDDFESRLDFVKNIETLLTSGKTSNQKTALESLDAFDQGDALRAASAPATSPSRPIVGGDRYVVSRGGDADPEAVSLRRKIEDRAQKVKRALNTLPQESLRATYPDFFESPRISRELEVNYDPDTDTVSPVTPDSRNVYGISISTGRPTLNPLAAQDIPAAVSLNALKFLADNPVLGTTSVTFNTKAPGTGYSYDPKELPAPVSEAFSRFAQARALEGLPPGTLVTNSPLGSSDLLEQKRRSGLTEDTSSTIRKLQPFVDDRQALPNLRGVAYQSAGFGPLSGSTRNQYAYIDSQGRVVPLQLTRPESGLAGEVKVRDSGEVEVKQNRLPLSSKAYYSVDPVVAAAQGLGELGRGIRRTPAALAPGLADLIPSPEAVQTGFRQGPVAMGRQMGQEFVQSLPTAAATASILASPPVAPFAPGIGAAMVGTAGAKALNEVVRQQTGEGIVPKLRQAIGTEPRTGVASPQRRGPAVTPQIRPLSADQRREMQRRQNRNELQRRGDLARERFNPLRGEFGLSELLFGR
jgi:hypothetical protein